MTENKKTDPKTEAPAKLAKALTLKSETAPVAVVDKKPEVTPPAVTAPQKEELPSNLIARTGVCEVGKTYTTKVSLGGQDIVMPFKVPAWAGKEGEKVTVTVGSPSKKWLGQNGGVELMASVYRSTTGSVVVMPHTKGVIIHCYPDAHRRSKILVEML